MSSQGGSAKPSGKPNKAPLWDEASLRLFYQAFHANGQDWAQIAGATGNKTPEQCEALWKQHQTFLSIPSQPAFETAFIAMVADHYNNIKDEPQEDATMENGGRDSGSAGNGVAASRKDDATAAGDEGATGENGNEDDEWGGNQAPEAGGRPVRSTRGKPPSRIHSPGDDDRPSKVYGTPGRGGKGALASPASSKQKSGKAGESESARKKRSRRLFNDDGGDLGPLDEHPDEDEPEAKSPYMQRWKGKHQQRDFEQGVDALLQLAMASSMDHMGGAGDQEGMDEEEEEGDVEDADAGGADAFPLPAGTLDRPGKRKVRPPSRLDGGFASPVKATTGGGGTPSRRGRATPTLQAASVRSPQRGTPRGNGRAAARNRSKGASRKIKEEDEDEEMDNMVDDDETEDEEETVPRSARQRTAADRRAAAAVREAEQALQATQAHMDSLLGADGQPFTLDQDTLAAMGMGSLQLPGLPNVMGMGGFPMGMGTPAMGMGAGGSSFPPPVSANMGPGRGTGRQRNRRRKPLVERPPPPDPGTTQQQQQQLMLRSMLGINRFDGANGAVAGANASEPLPLPLIPPEPTPESTLAHLLSSSSARRWIIYEWHYSTIDRPFFMRSELTELLASLGLGNLRRLTRGEWGLVRGSFGRARRLSLNFLREERMKLEAYREHVRRKYDEVGLGAEVSPELPKPLRVGQEVTARHPMTRQLHDGVILTIKGPMYRVQFHRPELLTEVVRDTDVMPCDPRENLPAIMSAMPLLLNGRSTGTAGGGLGPLARAKAKGTNLRGQQQQGGMMPAGMVPVTAAQACEDPEADAALVAEVSAKLEAKETLLAQLRELNSQSNVHQDQNGLHSESFQMHYTQTVLQLKEINTSLEAAYTRLQNRSNAAALGVLQSGAGIGAPQAANGSGGGAGGVLGNLAVLGGLGLAPDGLLPGVLPGIGAGMPNLVLPPPLTAHDLAARTIMHAAYTDAKAVVERYRDLRNRPAANALIEAAAGADAQATAAATSAAAAAAAAGTDNQGGASGSAPAAQPATGAQDAAHAASAGLDRVITSCLTVLCTVQRSVGEGMVPAAVEASLDLAALVVQATGNAGGSGGTGADGEVAAEGGGGPNGSNAALYTQLVDSIRVLKNQLVKAS